MINSNCALDCMNVATDIKIAGMMGQLVQHESDNDIHVTKEEKEKLKSITNDSEDNSDLTEIKLTLNNKADKDEIPTKLSQLENDTNFISSIPDFYTTEEEVKLLIEGYLEDYDGSGGSGGASDEDIKRLEQLIEDLTTLVNNNTTDIESIKKTLEEHSESITNIEQLIDTLEQSISNINQQIEQINVKIDNIEGGGSGGSYVLPIASATQLGGIKVGLGLSIDGAGVLSTTEEGGGGGSDLSQILEQIKGMFISKTQEDSTNYLLTLNNGLVVKKNDTDDFCVQTDIVRDAGFFSGLFGSGYSLSSDSSDSLSNFSSDGSLLEIDNLLVRRKAMFQELEIRKVSAIGGTLVLSNASGTIINTTNRGGGIIRCYLKADDGTTRTQNLFQPQDYVRCQTFNIQAGIYSDVKNKSYCLAVQDVGSDEILGSNEPMNYIDVIYQSGDKPEAGDVIVQYGCQPGGDKSRKNLIELSTSDVDAPCMKMYTGVEGIHSLEDHVQSIISPELVEFTTDVFRIRSGGNSYPIAVDRGKYDQHTTYYYYDRVSYEGSLWLCIYQGEEGVTGVEPSFENSEYWELQVSKGDKGDKGDQGESQDKNDIYSMSLDQDVFLSLYDSKTRKWSPDIRTSSININVYKNNELVTTKDVPYTASIIETNGDWTPSASVTEDASSYYITASNVRLTNGTADCTVQVSITDTNVKLKRKFTLIVSEKPTYDYDENGYTVFISPSNLELPVKYETEDRQITISNDPTHPIKVTVPVIKSITTDLSKRVNVMIFKGSKVITMPQITIEGSVNSDIMDYEGRFGITHLYKTTYTPNDTYQICIHEVPTSTVYWIPENFTDGEAVAFPVTSMNINIAPRHDRVPSTDVPVNVNLDGNGSIWEVTGTRFTSTFTAIDDMNINYSSIEQTADHIQSVVGQYLVDEDGAYTETFTQAMQTATSVEIGAYQDGLAACGLIVSLERGGDGNYTSTDGVVKVYGNKFQVYDRDLRYVMFTVDDGGYTTVRNLKAENAYVSGEVVATKGSVGAFSIQDDNLTSNKNGTVELTSNGLKIVSPTQSGGVEDSYIAFNTVNQKNEESTQFNSAAYIYNHGKESGQNYAALYINCDGRGNTYGILNASTTNTNGLVNNGVLVNNICPVTTTMNLNAYPFSKFIHYGSSTCTLNLPTNPADGMDIEFIVTNPRGKLKINTTNSNTILYIKDSPAGNVANVSSYVTNGAGIWRLIFLGQIQQLGPSTQAWFAFRITDNYKA